MGFSKESKYSETPKVYWRAAIQYVPGSLSASVLTTIAVAKLRNLAVIVFDANAPRSFFPLTEFLANAPRICSCCRICGYLAVLGDLHSWIITIIQTMKPFAVKVQKMTPQRSKFFDALKIRVRYVELQVRLKWNIACSVAHSLQSIAGAPYGLHYRLSVLKARRKIPNNAS